MNDVQFNAAALARHRASLERYARREEIAAAEQPSFAAALTETAAPPAPAVQPAAAVAAVAAPEDVSQPADIASPLPTLSDSQFALLEQSFAPVAAEAPAEATLETRAKAAAAKVELPPQQSALLAQSLGVSGATAAAGPQHLADAGIPVAREVSAVPRAKAADPALSPDQMSLLMASFGVSGHQAGETGKAEDQDTPAATLPAATAAAAEAQERRFFPTAPRADAGTAVLASDAYLRAMQSMEQNLGRYGQ